MLSIRLKTIADFISLDDIVLDVGTDHGYLPIYLKENNLCKNVYASDVSKNALENAKKNVLEKNLDIKLYLSNGLKDIDVFYNTLTISGMGTSTIKDILSNQDLPDKIILSSNNDLYELRKFMQDLGYKIIEEKAIFERKYYDIIYYQKGYEKLKYQELLYGKSNNHEYFKFLFEHDLNIYKKVNFKTKLKMYKNLRILKKLI